MWGLNLLYGGGVMESRFVIEIWPCLNVLAAFGYRAMASRFTRTSALRPERQAELEPIGPMETVQ
jgi:hypothetical protein